MKEKPRVFCSSMVKHPTSNRRVWGWNPHGGHEGFVLPFEDKITISFPGSLPSLGGGGVWRWEGERAGNDADKISNLVLQRGKGELKLKWSMVKLFWYLVNHMHWWLYKKRYLFGLKISEPPLPTKFSTNNSSPHRGSLFGDCLVDVRIRGKY